MTDTVDPEWVPVEVSRRSFELDKSSSFVLITVQNDLSNRLIILIVVDKACKKLVNHAALHTVSFTGLCAILEMLNASLDKVSAALPLSLCDARVEEFDCAGGMVEYLLPFESH